MLTKFELKAIKHIIQNLVLDVSVNALIVNGKGAYKPPTPPHFGQFYLKWHKIILSPKFE